MNPRVERAVEEIESLIVPPGSSELDAMVAIKKFRNSLSSFVSESSLASLDIDVSEAQTQTVELQEPRGVYVHHGRGRKAIHRKHKAKAHHKRALGRSRLTLATPVTNVHVGVQPLMQKQPVLASARDNYGLDENDLDPLLWYIDPDDDNEYDVDDLDDDDNEIDLDEPRGVYAHHGRGRHRRAHKGRRRGHKRPRHPRVKGAKRVTAATKALITSQIAQIKAGTLAPEVLLDPAAPLFKTAVAMGVVLYNPAAPMGRQITLP